MMHNNTRPDDTQLTFTTLGWMMWNHMLSTLGWTMALGFPVVPEEYRTKSRQMVSFHAQNARRSSL
jgi:hypothetical protein